MGIRFPSGSENVYTITLVVYTLHDKKHAGISFAHMERATAMHRTTPASIRPVVVLSFIFSHQPPQVFFGTAFRLGFSLHAIVAETWIDLTRPDAAK